MSNKHIHSTFCIRHHMGAPVDIPSASNPQHFMQFLNRFRFLKNFYWATSLGLLTWLLFFELNSIPDQVGNWLELRDLENQKEYYEELIELLKKEQASTLGTNELMEKYAREKYFMKKDSEEVFVLVDKNGEPFEK